MERHRITSEELSGLLARLRVRAGSPDRSVMAVLDLAGTHVQLAVAPQREDDLARQTTAALEAGRHGYRRARALLLEQAGDAPEPALDGVAATATSPDGEITVHRRGAHGVAVEIRPGALARHGHAGVQTSLNDAIGAADDRFDLECLIRSAAARH